MELKYFLVKGKIKALKVYEKHTSPDCTYNEVRLVLAESEEQAKDKYETYWDRKCNDHNSYCILSCEVLETIE